MGGIDGMGDLIEGQRMMYSRIVKKISRRNGG